MAIQLYQFAVSHYCEKVRWALDYKGIRYQPVYLLPGNHVATIRRFTRKTAVPVLVDDQQVIQGSCDIISYLDETYKDHPLTPTTPKLQEQALAWEQQLDNEAGVAIRCFCYHHLLQRPKAAIPVLAAQTPFYNRWILALTFSRVDEIMREWMKINERTAAKAEQVTTQTLDRLAKVYQKKQWLVGDTFTRADLTAAALYAPLFEPAQYPVPWPKGRHVPKGLISWRDQHQDKLALLAQRYAAMRDARP